MPAPITHMVYAQQLQEVRSELDQAPLLRGTIFPDVRHIAGIDRGVTHQPGKWSLEDIANEDNAWRAGYLLHNWLDDSWTEFFHDHYGLEKGHPEHEMTWATLKLLEQKTMRLRIRDVERVARELEVADPEAVVFGVDAAMVMHWGNLVAGELRAGWMSPHWEYFAVDGLRMDQTTVKAVRRRLAELQREGVWEGRLEQSWQELSGRLRKFR